jgi:hypothetical protein
VGAAAAKERVFPLPAEATVLVAEATVLVAEATVLVDRRREARLVATTTRHAFRSFFPDFSKSCRHPDFRFFPDGN